MLTEPGERVVEVVYRKHDAQVTEGVHRGSPVISHDWGREESRELESAVAVRSAHHGDLDALVGQPGDTP